MIAGNYGHGIIYITGNLVENIIKIFDKIYISDIERRRDERFIFFGA